MIGYINKIETLAAADGPGIRVSVFMQGCTLMCLYCHNPEMFVVNSGTQYTPLELVDYILKYKPYFGTDGGVTFSGGEPLLQSGFLIEVSKLLKQEDIHIVLDTAGIGLKNKELLKYIDIVLMDVKYIDSEGYKMVTGVDKFKESTHFLEECLNENKEIWFRQVIVPGINDNEEYISKLNKFIECYKHQKIDLLPFHTMGFSKYKDLGIENKLINTPALDKEKFVMLSNLVYKSK